VELTLAHAAAFLRPGPKKKIPRPDPEPGDPIRRAGYAFLRGATGASGCWTK
jgi:hypothetical protein